MSVHDIVSMEPSAQGQHPHSVSGPPHATTQETGRRHFVPHDGDAVLHEPGGTLPSLGTPVSAVLVSVGLPSVGLPSVGLPSDVDVSDVPVSGTLPSPRGRVSSVHAQSTNENERVRRIQ